MKTIFTITAAILTIALAACSSPQTAEPTPTVTSTPAASTPTVEPTEPAAPEYVAPEVGATVPANDIEKAREAGAAVYISPNGKGDGVVFNPADAKALSMLLSPDIKASGSTQKYKTLADLGQAGLQLKAISDQLSLAPGANAFAMIRTADFDGTGTASNWGYTLVALGTDALAAANNPDAFLGDSALQETKAGALAAYAPIIEAVPGAVIIDLT